MEGCMSKRFRYFILHLCMKHQKTFLDWLSIQQSRYSKSEHLSFYIYSEEKKRCQQLQSACNFIFKACYKTRINSHILLVTNIWTSQGTIPNLCLTNERCSDATGSLRILINKTKTKKQTLKQQKPKPESTSDRWITHSTSLLTAVTLCYNNLVYISFMSVIEEMEVNFKLLLMLTLLIAKKSQP